MDRTEPHRVAGTSNAYGKEEKRQTNKIFSDRIREADEFYDLIIPRQLSDDARTLKIIRCAC